jgi:hypothetical protein
MKLDQPLTVYLPDTRGVKISPYGCGNLKIGPSVYTYSRPAGSATLYGTCPGATNECEAVCYAKRIEGPVAQVYLRNTGHVVPPIPSDCRLLRLHVSGDFDSPDYIASWIERLTERPDVTMWVYTRSWRVPRLLPMLEQLRALANVQMFASMDKSHTDVPPAGWRRAWIDGDPRAGDPQRVRAHLDDPVMHNLVTFDGQHTYVCPEETKRQPNCEACGHCFKGSTKDVTFLLH